jgi:hypothetical protein
MEWLRQSAIRFEEDRQGPRTGISVYASGDDFTDRDLEELCRLKNLRELYLMDTPQVTDAGLAHLGQRSDLQQLIVTHTGITGAGLRFLRGLTDLRGLGLCDTRIDAIELAELQSLTNLRTLYLDQCSIDDATIQPLRNLTGLYWLSLCETRVTAYGAAELKAALPGTRIVR